MRVVVNDKPVELDSHSTVAVLLEALEHYDTRGLAVAVNNQVFPRSGWASQRLNEGDRVTLIRAAAGG